MIMNLTRWQIIFARENESDRVGHPAVILSGPDILSDDRQLRFNVLMGTKRPPAAAVLPHQVLLDQADGLEFSTLINCALVYVVRKNAILRDAGTVTHLHRAEIARRVRASLGVW
jgi:mRNA-degrading endonuclease toxin of MazEF toxin-antitoxin module